MDEAVTLEALAVRATEGDAAALSSLARQLTPSIFQLCLRMLGERPLAEDATQDVLVKVITSLSSFAGRARLSTWVHQITVRHVWSLARSRAEARAMADLESFAELLEHGLAYGATVPPLPGPEEHVLVGEIRRSCTQGMLLALGREDRLALVLSEILGLDSVEAAEIAGTTPDAFRQRLSRARARMTTFLRERCGVVSSTARCTCARQVPARRALGMSPTTRTWTELAAPPDEAVVAEAASELRLVARLFRGEARVEPAAALKERLAALLPTVLGR